MKQNISLDLNKLNLCQKIELLKYLNEEGNSNFNNWDLKDLSKKILHNLTYYTIVRKWVLTEDKDVQKNKLTEVDYTRFKEIISDDRN